MNSHLRVLVAEKELREKRKLGIRVITDESGASRSAVQRLLNNTIKMVPLDDLAALCDWLPCDVGQLLRAEDIPEATTTPRRRQGRTRAADGTYTPTDE